MKAFLSCVYCGSINLVNIVVILLVVNYNSDKEIKRHISSPEIGILEFTDISSEKQQIAAPF